MGDNFPQRFSFPVPGSKGWTREQAQAWVDDVNHPAPFPFTMERHNGITTITYTDPENRVPPTSITIPEEREDDLVFCLEGGC